ncbi:MotA/TolQ/ExbB proton channel family protein [Rhodocytophaga rosea]|uniref:MotA/TolQ/ExbB proton channel family protein n=1 Tax=Rhodocytophaga rosea TaxID=2704465 RepID=A0A6C0GFR9_9BACT|nr:MotA/TolQ/ExbB proton channel family protein [Rhodocytophaga rosea]QHT66530.1 MotA/TolQ/ExbB proton channel family protein [Rhodocytophaga rosea]
MKKLLASLMLAGTLTLGFSANLMAQDTTSTTTATDTATTATEDAGVPVSTATDDAVAEEQSFHQIVKENFISGGVEYMVPILLCFIFGLAIAIERIITLNLASTNTKKLLTRVEDALNTGGVEAAKEVTRSTRGPVASIFTQGLMRAPEGVDMVEKSIVSYGSVEMGKLEKGLVWLSLFIALAPMLGFLGTVVGMIFAFQAIAAAGDVSPTVVASGIQVALITTVGGLIVAIILQVFYNYLVTKIDSIVSQMEDASITLVDTLVKYNITKGGLR